MKVSFLLLFIFSFSAFANFEGTLQFDQPITYKKFICEKTAIPGDYLVKVVKASKSLTLKFTDIDGKNHSIKIKMPRYALPEDGGSITLKPSQTGQEFGITANLESKQISSDERRGYESCSIQVRVRRCQRDETGRERCQDYYESRPGRQFVQYSVISHQQDILIDFLDDQDQNFGNAATRTIVSSIEYLYRGTCQPTK